MTTEAAATKSLLQDLVGAFCEHPEAVRVNCQMADDGAGVYWVIGCHPEDEGKLIGYDGAHSRALHFLVREFGRAEEIPYTLRLLTPSEPTHRKRREKDVFEYDPTNMRQLLTRTLSALAIGAFSIGITNTFGSSLTYTFSVKVIENRDYRTLIGSREGGTQTAIECLGVLFRAIAKNDGVRVQINVERSSPPAVH